MDPSERTDLPAPPADMAALAFAAVFPFAAAWLYLVVLAGRESAVVQAAYGAAKVLQFALPVVWVVFVCRQTLSSRDIFRGAGLSPARGAGVPPAGHEAGTAAPRLAGVRVGLLSGAAVVSGMLLLYFFWLRPEQFLTHFAPLIATKARTFGMGTPLGFIVGAVLLSMVHSLLEEYYWRWFLFGGLRRYMPVAAAVVLSSLAFTAHHVVLLSGFFGGLTLPAVFFSLCVFVGGAVWAWLYHRSGSLLGPWLSHALIDAGIFIVGFDMLWR